VSTQILATKLHRPTVASDLVRLPRALELLDEGAAMPLTLVSAPAGYGKSTLVSSWLEGRAEPSAWLTLDEADADLTVFVHYLAAAIHTALPDACRRTLALLAAPEPPSLSTLTVNLGNELEALEQPLTLVLDDYQRIGEPAIHDLLSELLTHPAPPLHLVVVTRQDPPFPLTALRAHAQLTEVRMGDLRLRRSEAAELLKAQTGIVLNEAALDNLDKEIEGWVVGLRLVGLALRSQGDPNAFASKLRGGLPSLREYLISEVLDAQSAALRDWLLRTSILNRFCASLCEAVCRADSQPSASELDGQTFLESLDREGLFAIPLDARHEWYRYHHVLQDLLRDELRRSSGAERIAALHSKASAWYREHGLTEEAVQHALAAGDSTGAAKLVAEQRHALMNQEAWQRLARLLEMIPTATTATAVPVLIANAWTHHYFFRLDEARSLLAKAEDRSERLTLPEADSLRAEIAALRALDWYVADEASSAIEPAERALTDLSPEASCMRGYAAAVKAWAHQVSGESRRAVDFLAHELETHRSLDPAFHARVLAGFALVHFKDGDLKAVLPPANRLLELGKTHDLSESTLFGRAFLGWSHYLRNELDAAEPHLRAVVRDRDLVRRVWSAHCAFALALIYEAQNRADDAEQLMEAIVRHAIALELPAVLEEARAFQAELALRHGRNAEALEWSRTFRSDRPILFPYFYIPQTTFAKVQLAQGTAESRKKAEATLHSLHNALRASHDRRRQADVLALLALSQDALGKESEAFRSLNEALALTEAGGATRPFADLGAPMASLLERLPEYAVGEEHLKHISAAFALSDSTSNAAQLEEALTNREQDVLELLAQRLRDKEIAQELVVSPGTVKSHLKGLYQKLGVHSRREAVFKARALGILTGD